VIRLRSSRLLIACGLLLATFTATVLLVVIAQQGRILPGTTVLGVDIGGTDVASARRILMPEVAAETRRSSYIAAPGAQLRLDPRDVDLTIDLTATIEDAFARGRRWHVASLAARLLAPLRTVEVPPHRSIDPGRLAAWVETAAQELERTDSVGDLDITPDGATFDVAVVGPHGALRVDREASVTRLHAALTAGERRAALVVTTELPPVGRAPIERLADDVRHTLRRPMVLRHDGRRLSIGPEVLAQLLEVGTTLDRDGRPGPALEVPTHRVRELLGPEGSATFDRPARDARILTDREPATTLSALGPTTFRPVEVPVRIEPGQSRVTFVPRLTAAQVVELITARRHAAVAAVDEQEPDLTTAAALAGRPTHLLGTFTTFYAAGGARTVNIRLLADILDDRPIAPGATFSVNGTSGPRRCEDGFLPAGTIIRGELVDTCGGGVSQVGTTVVNAAFFAGVTLDQWQPHSFAISRYPDGREATLSYPELDVRFTNDTDGWLVLRASTTPESITVTIYGVPRWQEVRADHGERRAPTDFGREERVTTALPPGVRRVVQSGGGGFTITVTRTRTPIDGTQEVTRERWTTVYRPQLRIVEVGAARVAPD
jgi:vancomycin resistance protein YoaR